MDKIADYTGALLNHVEALYRPGERELAVELAEALGCAITDTGFKGDAGETFLAIHPNPDDRNVGANVFYISQMTPEQHALEQRLAALVGSDATYRAELDAFRAKARSRPFGVPHFSLRYASDEAIEAAAAAIERKLAPKLGDRLHFRIYRPGDSDAAGGDVIQAFVHQDVIVSGSFLHGQLIELQAHP